MQCDGKGTRCLAVRLCWGVVTVRVLYFAGLRDSIGTSEETLELPPGVMTVGALAEHLAARHPAFAARRAYVRIARNEAFASDDEALADGDVVALIPPVAGG
jgi:molybdopterin synthase sulfur carrier subunit